MPRILIIDDEPLVRTVLRSLLEREGYTVMEASNGRAGLALWRHTPSDLVLTDMFMPHQDGIEVIVQLTRIWPHAKIIAMTGGGGWPMSVFLTPDLRPFHAGTYYPGNDRKSRCHAAHFACF